MYVHHSCEVNSSSLGHYSECSCVFIIEKIYINERLQLHNPPTLIFVTFAL